MKRRPCTTTGDLLTWQPPNVAAGFRDVRGHDLRTKIADVVGQVLGSAGMSRADIAQAMSARLGANVSKDMLDAYASPAKEGHQITFERLIALCEVTQSVDALGFAAGLMGHVVVPDRYSAIITKHLIAEQRRRLDALEAAVDSDLKAVRP